MDIQYILCLRPIYPFRVYLIPLYRQKDANGAFGTAENPYRGFRFAAGRRQKPMLCRQNPAEHISNITSAPADIIPILCSDKNPDMRFAILRRQALSALQSSSCQNLTAVFGAHSFSETMLFGTMSFLRLVCSQHHYPSFSFRKDIAYGARTA